MEDNRIEALIEAENMIKRHEGFSGQLYRCPRGKLTIGYGYNIEDRGLPKDLCESLLERDLSNLMRRLSQFEWFSRLNTKRKAAILDMAYQLGVAGLLNFRKSLQLLKEEKYKEAAQEMLNSAWAKQTPNRAQEITSIIERGE